MQLPTCAALAAILYNKFTANICFQLKNLRLRSSAEAGIVNVFLNFEKK